MHKNSTIYVPPANNVPMFQNHMERSAQANTITEVPLSTISPTIKDHIDGYMELYMDVYRSSQTPSHFSTPNITKLKADDIDPQYREKRNRNNEAVKKSRANKEKRIKRLVDENLELKREKDELGVEVKRLERKVNREKTRRAILMEEIKAMSRAAATPADSNVSQHTG